MIRKTVIKNAITNHLVDNTIDDEESLNLDFYDEYVIILKTKKDNEESLQWTMYFEGTINMSRNGVGALIISLNGCQNLVSIHLQFECIDNMFENEACIHGLEVALEM